MSTTTDVRLKARYKSEIQSALKSEFGYSNPMQIPTLVKIVVNMGVGEAARDSKLIEGAIKDLAIITGQKPQVTKSRKSIAQFKLREGMPIGAHVTLRGDRMWEFADRLLSISLPRIRDFRGFHQSNLMERATTPSVLPSRLYSQKSNKTRSTAHAVWISRS